MHKEQISLGIFVISIICWHGHAFGQQVIDRYPPAIQVTWESSQLRTAEFQKRLAFDFGLRDKSLPHETLKLIKTHKLICHRNQVRYETTGDIPSQSAPGGSVKGVCTSVYDSRRKKTTLLNTLFSGGGRDYPLGMIYDGNTLAPGPDMSLWPLISWLTTTGQLTIDTPTLPREMSDMEALSIVHNNAGNELVIEWGHPDIATGKANPMSFQGISRMKFQIVDGRRIPMSWTMESFSQGKVERVTTAKLSQVNFLERVQPSTFELDFPPATSFIDKSVVPHIYGVIDKMGNVRGREGESLGLPHDKLISEDSPLPILRRNKHWHRQFVFVISSAGIIVTACIAARLFINRTKS